MKYIHLNLGKKMLKHKSAGPIGMIKLGQRAVLAFIVFSSVAVANVSFAAGRVFYDGFESGNTNLWKPDDYRNRCQVVTAAADGVAGPFAGSKMLRCNDNGTVAWNDPAAFESLTLDNISYSKELFIRTRVRADKNLQRTSGSPKKIMRVFNWTGVQSLYNDIYEVIYTSNGFRNEGLAGGVQFATYWGGAGGDSTGNSGGWHRVEYYINASTGNIKVWHDGVLVRNDIGLPTGSAKWLPFNITSNWSDAHGATNYVYFDEFEIFSDTGTGATGSMSDASVSGSGSSTPPVSTQLSPPTNVHVL